MSEIKVVSTAKRKVPLSGGVDIHVRPIQVHAISGQSAVPYEGEVVPTIRQVGIGLRDIGHFPRGLMSDAEDFSADAGIEIVKQNQSL